MGLDPVIAARSNSLHVVLILPQESIQKMYVLFFQVVASEPPALVYTEVSVPASDPAGLRSHDQIGY